MSECVVVSDLTIRCCGCDGKVTFVAPKEDDETDRPTMLHTVPMCARFDTTNTTDELIQYMRDCGDARELN